MDFLNAIMGCLTGTEPANERRNVYITDLKSSDTKPNDEDLAESILSILFTSEKAGKDLNERLQDLVSTNGWHEKLAKRVLDGVVHALESGAAMGGAMKETYDKVTAVANQFIDEHPVLVEVAVTLIAIGIMALLIPWAVEALGFAELGPIEGSFAAWWQSTIGDVEAGSLFAYFQRLGMRWGKK